MCDLHELCALQFLTRALPFLFVLAEPLLGKTQLQNLFPSLLFPCSPSFFQGSATLTVLSIKSGFKIQCLIISVQYWDNYELTERREQTGQWAKGTGTSPGGWETVTDKPFNSLTFFLSHIPLLPCTDRYPQAFGEDENLLFAPHPFSCFIINHCWWSFSSFSFMPLDCPLWPSEFLENFWVWSCKFYPIFHSNEKLLRFCIPFSY